MYISTAREPQICGAQTICYKWQEATFHLKGGRAQKMIVMCTIYSLISEE